MGNATKVIIALIAVVVIAGGVSLLSGGNDEPANNTENTTSNNSGVSDNTGNDSTDDQTESTAITITYGENGFSPAQVTVQAGTRITVINQSDGPAEPSSDPHPVHTDNPELNFGELEPGESETVTVTTIGSWGMHDHLNKDKKARIIVE